MDTGADIGARPDVPVLRHEDFAAHLPIGQKRLGLTTNAMIDLGHAVTLWQAGCREEAQRLVRDAGLARKNDSPMYDFQLDVLRTWGYGELLA